MIIYKITNRVNGRSYIGQTVKSLKQRKRKHLSDAKFYRDSFYFHNAIRKYGLRNFKWEIIHWCGNINFLNQLEIFYIGYYDTYNNGYNLTEGGGGVRGHKHSDETRKKIFLTRIGKKYSAETLKKMSAARLGKKVSAEIRKKISLAKIGKNNPSYGKRGKDSFHAKAVIINNKRFDTLKKAAGFVGIGAPGVRRRILHKTKWLDYRYVENVMEVQDVKGSS